MEISHRVTKRLPIYLQFLKQLPEDCLSISSKVIADSVGLGNVQVRKDLALVSGEGKPKIGYEVKSLINSLEAFLGYDSENDAVLIGAGKLGSALFEYEGFNEYGINIVAAFDKDISKVRYSSSGKYVYPLWDFEAFCRQRKIKIGIITVNTKEAQQACNLMCDNGIKAIWNFAPTYLEAEGDVLIQTENMAASLALLIGHLAK